MQVGVPFDRVLGVVGLVGGNFESTVEDPDTIADRLLKVIVANADRPNALDVDREQGLGLLPVQD